MYRKMRSSRVLRSAEKRATAIGSIGPDVDLGNGLSLENFAKTISDVRASLVAYHKALARSDAAANAFEASEKALRDLSVRMLAGIAAKFGKDSVEYSNAGGVRTSDRKRPSRKKNVAA
ncbi:MAG: hypothetical protein HY720_29610 [Planctomycetes bacterium]|nr:hypothetical protein [Planctomycetota bacterium]